MNRSSVVYSSGHISSIPCVHSNKVLAYGKGQAEECLGCNGKSGFILTRGPVFIEDSMAVDGQRVNIPPANFPCLGGIPHVLTDNNR